MKNVTDFLKTYKHAVSWTLSYIVIIYLILFLLFGFDLFSLSNWSTLLNSRLHGFAGFAFGSLLFAIIPLYIATINIIIKNKKPLFTFFAKKEEPKKIVEEKKEVAPEIIPDFPDRMPNEIKGAFLRARKNIVSNPESAFDMKDIRVNKEESKKQDSKESVLPLPDNFDFTHNESSSDIQETSVPVFKEINFGYVEESKEKKSPLIKHLESNGYEIAFDGNIVIANNFAIAVHDDSDFWIADKDNWFAAGKQKESPISEVLLISEKHDVNAMIYLAEKNIMDIDSRIAEWESKGIKVIKNLSEI